MEDAMANVILTELREFRTENNKKWEENDKRWEENEKRWEQNEKRWQENEKRWEENNRRWEENDKELQKINKRIDNVNDSINERINRMNDSMNEKIDNMNEKVDRMNDRIVNLEEGRKKDRRDILVVLDTMEKSISNQFAEMKEYFDAKFDKVFSAQRFTDIENEQFKKLFCAHEKRLNFYNARLNYLEEWKQQFDMGEYTAV